MGIATKATTAGTLYEDTELADGLPTKRQSVGQASVE